MPEEKKSLTPHPSVCSIPYPERFHAAVEYAHKLNESGQPLPDESRLLLYGLGQQATEGPCSESKPWGWNVVESAKWHSWKQLGPMPKIEAMRLYVRTLEEEHPTWYKSLDTHKDQNSAAVVTVVGKAEPKTLKSLQSVIVDGQWVTLPLQDQKKPLPRYEQGCALIGSTLFVLGGHYAGRYLSDSWAFDFNELEWTNLSIKLGEGPPPSSVPNPPPLAPPLSLAPSAGHSVTPWKESLVVLGGHVKSKDVVPDMRVRLLDTHSFVWSMLQPSGTSPVSRGGHSATLVGTSIYVFGGEDKSRRALDDLHVLDLNTVSWSSPTTTGKGPAARSAHVATSYGGRYLIIFGGGSVAMCFSDVHVLDLETLTWSQPRCEGVQLTPRAGHSSALYGTTWYIAGGGNNVKGCTDVLAADLSDVSNGVITFSVVVSVPVRSHLSSEGVSLACLESERCLIAFGGYNGKYTNSISVLGLPVPDPATIKAHKADPSACLPAKAGQEQTPTGGTAPADKSHQVQKEPTPQSPRKQIPAVPPQQQAVKSVEELVRELEAVRKETEDARQQAETATAAKESASLELTLLRRQLISAQTAIGDAERKANQLEEALQQEQSKVLKLEAELAELQSGLSKVEELERELERYRARELEQEQAAKKTGGGGLWGYISGA